MHETKTCDYRLCVDKVYTLRCSEISVHATLTDEI